MTDTKSKGGGGSGCGAWGKWGSKNYQEIKKGGGD